MNKVGIASLFFNGLVAGLVLAGCAGGNAIDEAVPPAAFGDLGPPVPAQRPGTETEAEATTPDAVAPDTAAAPPAAPRDTLFSGSGQAANTGAYPNINNEPRGAAPQLTDEQRANLLAEMQALAVAQSKGLVSRAEYQRRLAALRRLAATHSDEAIRTIEN